MTSELEKAVEALKKPTMAAGYRDAFNDGVDASLQVIRQHEAKQLTGDRVAVIKEMAIRRLADEFLHNVTSAHIASIGVDIAIEYATPFLRTPTKEPEMGATIQVGDPVWCRKGFGFIVSRIEREGGRPVYYGDICGEEIYSTAEATRKVSLPPAPTKENVGC